MNAWRGHTEGWCIFRKNPTGDSSHDDRLYFDQAEAESDCEPGDFVIHVLKPTPAHLKAQRQALKRL